MKERKPFTTSWDDGDPRDVQIADLLDANGLKGTFYASTGPSGVRTISDEGLRDLGARHELGNHGRSHLTFPSLSDENLRSEMIWGEESLRGCGDFARIVAPPKGKMDQRVVGVLGDMGYAVRSAPVLASRSSRVRWLEPTYQFFPHGWEALVRNAGSRRLLPASPLVLAWARGGSLRDRAMRGLQAAIDALPSVHVWGHSWEVDELGQWEALGELLSAASSLGVQPMTNFELAEWLQRVRT